MTETPYDDVPYDSKPFAHTDPETLYSIAKLFGVQAVSYKNCKVLELGCASAGNLLPMAINYPHSTFVGIDLSKKQIDFGNEHIKNLGLTNIKLFHQSILDIDKDFGEFDYIITHGIFSWVNEEVRDKIFQVSDQNLSPNGIAYISYNTLPGWNMLKSIREMMLYHTKNLEDPNEKISQARLLLDFIEQAHKGSESPYLTFIKSESQFLSSTHPSYLFHEHLSEKNHPFYFSEFMEQAHAHDLQYLANSELSAMFLGNMPKNVQEALSQITESTIATEQYMDFVRNRRFRSTLLCKEKCKIDRTLTNDSIRDFYFLNNMSLNEKSFEPNEAGNYVLESSSSYEYHTNDETLLESIRVLSKPKCKPLSIQEIVDAVHIKFDKKQSKTTLEEHLLNKFLYLILIEGISFSSDNDENHINTVFEKPVASPLSRYQVGYSSWVTTQESTVVSLDDFDKIMLPYLNGENNIDTIIRIMLEHVEKEDFTIIKDGKELTNEDPLISTVEELTRERLQSYAEKCLLVTGLPESDRTESKNLRI